MNKIVETDGTVVHYGVIGQRWGVRNNSDSSRGETIEGSNKSVKTDQVNKHTKLSGSQKIKDIKTIFSDDDVKEFIGVTMAISGAAIIYAANKSAVDLFVYNIFN